MLRERSPPAQARRGCKADAGDGAARGSDRDRAGDFSCRDCEAISHPPLLSSRPEGMGRAEPAAMIIFEKSASISREPRASAMPWKGAPIALSTLATPCAAVAAAIDPLAHD